MAVLIQDLLNSKNLKQTDMIGPLPCYYPRLYGLWRWQIVLRGPDPKVLLADLPLKAWQVEIDPPSLL